MVVLYSILSKREFLKIKSLSVPFFVFYKDNECTLCSQIQTLLKQIPNLNYKIYQMNLESHDLNDLSDKNGITQIPALQFFGKNNTTILYGLDIKYDSIIKLYDS